jgi:molybdopterin biosynthesis enzyme MoaB
MGTVLSPDLLPNTQHAEHYRDRWRALGATVGGTGVSGSTLVVNFAGSHAAVREGMTNPTHHRRLT